jgi:hypothetical protein
MTGMAFHFDITQRYHGRWDHLLHSSGRMAGASWEKMEMLWVAHYGTFRKQPCCLDTRPLVDFSQVFAGSGLLLHGLSAGFPRVTVALVAQLNGKASVRAAR